MVNIGTHLADFVFAKDAITLTYTEGHRPLIDKEVDFVLILHQQTDSVRVLGIVLQLRRLLDELHCHSIHIDEEFLIRIFQ